MSGKFAENTTDRLQQYGLQKYEMCGSRFSHVLFRFTRYITTRFLGEQRFRANLEGLRSQMIRCTPGASTMMCAREKNNVPEIRFIQLIVQTNKSFVNDSTIEINILVSIRRMLLMKHHLSLFSLQKIYKTLIKKYLHNLFNKN